MVQHASAINHTEALENFPELWTEILKNVQQKDRLQHVALVSRSFKEACRDPSLWRVLRLKHTQVLTKARWRSLLLWLTGHASGLRSLQFLDDHDSSKTGNTAAVWERRALQLIAVLEASAPQLRMLDHRYRVSFAVSAASALPSGLGRLRQLTCLTLDFGSAHVTTAQVNTMLQSLPLLQRLSLLGTPHTMLNGFPFSIVGSCTQLRDLEIRSAYLDVPPELGRLTQLTRLELASRRALRLPASISQLTALRQMGVSGGAAFSLPFGLLECRQLTSLTFQSDVRSPVLARLHTLQFLQAGPEDEEHVHAEEWSQLSALTELHIRCGPKGILPSGLQGIRGLCKLHISSATLHDLPQGPYLSSLESVCMSRCTFHAGVPSSLAAAAQLRHLDLEIGNVGLLLTSADMAMMSAMPRLIILRLRRPSDVSQSLWSDRMACLQAMCFANGQALPALIQKVEVVEHHGCSCSFQNTRTMQMVQPRCAALSTRADAGAPQAGRHLEVQRHTVSAPRQAPPKKLKPQAFKPLSPAAGLHTCSSHAASAFPPSWGSEQGRHSCSILRSTQESASVFSASARPSYAAFSAQSGRHSSRRRRHTGASASTDDVTRSPDAGPSSEPSSEVTSHTPPASRGSDRNDGGRSSTSSADTESQGCHDISESSEDSKTASIQLEMPRRSMQLTFTCGKCGATTKRMINRLAWEKGLVFAQCGGCEVWHNIRDAAGLVQEYRFKDGEEVDPAEFSTSPTEWQTLPGTDSPAEDLSD